MLFYGNVMENVTREDYVRNIENIIYQVTIWQEIQYNCFVRVEIWVFNESLICVGERLTSKLFWIRNMEPMFYIGIRPHANGRYYIHADDCPLLPSPWKRICLGTFMSPEEALEEGEKYFKNACCCSFCLGVDHRETEVAKSVEICEKTDSITYIRIKRTVESALIYGLNW